MIGKSLFILKLGNRLNVFESEKDARNFADSESWGSDLGTVYEVMGLRECSIADYNYAIVEAEQRKVDELRIRLGVPMIKTGTVK